jgi:hypothetical protein
MTKSYKKRKWIYELPYNKIQTQDISLDPSSIDDSVFADLLLDIKYFKKIYKDLLRYTDGKYTLENLESLTDSMIMDIVKNGFRTADTHLVASLTKSPTEDISFDVSQPSSNEETSFGIFSVSPNLVTCYSSDELKVKNKSLLNEGFVNVDKFPKDNVGTRFQYRALVSWELSLCLRGEFDLNSIIATDEIVFTSATLDL